MVSNFLLSAVTVFLVLRPSLVQSNFYPSHLSLSTFLLRFVPIGALFALDITLTNLSFQHVPVSLTEVIKGFSPAALMLYEMAQPHSTPSIAKAMVIVMLSAGIALTSMGELEFNEADDLFIGGAAAVGALVSGVVKFILLERLLLEEDTAQADGALGGAVVGTGAAGGGGGGAGDAGGGEGEEAQGEGGGCRARSTSRSAHSKTRATPPTAPSPSSCASRRRRSSRRAAATRRSTPPATPRRPEARTATRRRRSRAATRSPRCCTSRPYGGGRPTPPPHPPPPTRRTGATCPPFACPWPSPRTVTCG